MMSNADTVVILDFETTGLSPDGGDRAIEIGAVRIEKGIIKERFQKLMNPGRPVDAFIANYTGISNAMLKDAPCCEEVMDEFADFIGGHNLVAHNASFDKRFLDAEMARISRHYAGTFACSMLVARRIYQDAPNHQLRTLIDHLNIPVEGAFHRALYDSEMTSQLWLTMLEKIADYNSRNSIPFSLLQKLAKTPKKGVEKLLRR